MYTIFCDGVCIFSNNTPSDQMQIVEASLSLEDNSTGSLDFKVIPQENSQGMATIVSGNTAINVRSSPKIDSSNILGSVKNGDAITIYSETSYDGSINWRQMQFDGKEAWIDEKWLSITKMPKQSIKISRMKSKITVFRDDEELFEGRAISEESDFMENTSYHCEGCLAYLLDTLQEPEDYTGTVPEFLKKMVETHNSKVSDDKKFVLGYISTEYTDKTVSAEINYDKTLDVINSVLTDSEDSDLKGHLYVRFQNGERHLDYIKSGSNTNSQIVQFGENLLDLSKNYDESSLSTVILPLGGEIEEEVDEETTETKRIDISSVNGGSKYLANDELVSRYGRIEQLVEFDEITEPAKLLEQAKLWFADQQFEEMELEVSVMDLHYRNPDLQPFHMLDNVRCVSRYHGMDRYFPVTKMEIDLCNPDGTRITFNETKSQNISTSTARTGEIVDAKIKDIPKVDEDAILKEAQRNATELLNTAMTGYVTLLKNERDGHLEAIIISDTEDYTQSTDLWRWNVNGFAHSKNGGILWDTAITMDGQMVADFITAGTMSADRIRGGSLVIGGVGGHDGSIEVYNDDGDLIGKWDKHGAFLQTDNSKGESIMLQQGLFSVMNNGLEVGYINANQAINYEEESGKGVRIAGRGGLIFRAPVFGVGQEGFLEHTQGGLYDVCGNGTIPILTNVYTEDGKIKYEYRNVRFSRGMMVTDLGGNPSYGGGDDEPNVNPSMPTIDQDEIENRYKSMMITQNRFSSDVIVPGDQSYKPGMSILDAFPALEEDIFDNYNRHRNLDIYSNKAYLIALGWGMMSITENCTRSSKRANVGRVVGELNYDSGLGKYKYGNQVLPDTPLIETGIGWWTSTSNSIEGASSWINAIDTGNIGVMSYGQKRQDLPYNGLSFSEKMPSYTTFNNMNAYVFIGYYYDSWYITLFEYVGGNSPGLRFYCYNSGKFTEKSVYFWANNLWNTSEDYDHQETGQYLKTPDEQFTTNTYAGLIVRSDLPEGHGFFTYSTNLGTILRNMGNAIISESYPYYRKSLRSTFLLESEDVYSKPETYKDGKTAFKFSYYSSWLSDHMLPSFQMYFENGSLFLQLGLCWTEGATGVFRSKYRLFKKIFFVNDVTVSSGDNYILPRIKIHPQCVTRVSGKLDRSGIFRFYNLSSAQAFYTDIINSVNT